MAFPNQQANAATAVQLDSQISQTSEDILARYRLNRDWKLYPKEWIYRNIDFKNKLVLDFGCGTGEITTQLAALGAGKVFALDVTPGLLDLTRKRAEYDGVSDRVETVCGLIQDVEPQLVDVIVAFAVLHHCFPLENVVAPLLRWLKPGGTFVAVEPVVYLPFIEHARNLSGIPGDELDEGERKLTGSDVEYVLGHLRDSKTIPFHLLGRLSRIYPEADKVFRHIDRLMLRIPGMRLFSGTAMLLGTKPD